MNNQDMIARVQEAYPDAEVTSSGEYCSFEMKVVSPAFKEMNRLKRQQSVMNLFKDELLSGKLHALTVKVHAPDEL